MKKNIIPLILIGALFVSILFGKVFLVPKEDKHLAKGFTIDKFDTEVEIFKNNTFSVNEHITVNWTEAGHSGISRVLSNWEDFTSSDGKKYNKFINISQLYSPDQFLDVEKLSNNQLKLTTGKPSDKISVGTRTYQIRYNGNFGDDLNSDFDEFIFHAYGDNWGTKIGNPSLRITLPTQVENANIKFYADKNRKFDITDKVNYSITGRDVVAKIDAGYDLQDGLTVAIILPNGYFSDTTNPYNNVSAYICGFVTLVFISLLILWIGFKKSNSGAVTNSSEIIPNDLDSSQVGYIYRNCESSKKLTVSLIMSLVSKGYIKIIDIGKNEFTAFNLCASQGDKFRNSQNISVPQDLIFVSQDKLENLSINESIVYNKLFEQNDVNELYNDKEFYTVFSIIDSELQSKIKSKLKIKTSRFTQIFSWIMTILSIMLMIFAYFAVHDTKPQLQFLYILGWASCICAIIPSFFIGKASIYGEEANKRVNKLVSFIDDSDSESITIKMQSDVKFFYSVLPYAYSMSLHKKWIDKFKNISIPEEIHKKMDSVNYFDYYMLDNISDNLRYPVSDNEEK